MFNYALSCEGFNPNIDQIYEQGHDQLWSAFDFDQGITYADDMQNLVEIETFDGAHDQFNANTVSSMSLENMEMAAEFADLQAQKEKVSSSLALLEFIKSYKPSLDKILLRTNKEHRKAVGGGGEANLSTIEIAKIAAAYYVDSSVREGGGKSFFSHPFELIFSGLSTKENQNIELTRYLFAAADKVSRREFGEAREFLRRCFWMSSYTGEAIGRVVYYFADALLERIDKETNTVAPELLQDRIKPVKEIVKLLTVGHPVNLVTQTKLVAGQFLQHTAVQTILDNLESAKKIHIIDLSIRYGFQWTIMIQALSIRLSCPVDYLKITALLTSETEETIIAAGKHLKEFADSLGVTFYFDTVSVSDLKELKEDMFGLEADEAIGVFSSNMSTMILQPEGLDNLMRVIRKMKARIMVVVDGEVNLNSPSFTKRFAESFFFYAAYFDYFEACLEGDEASRLFLEGCIFSEGIKNIVAAEGSERLIRFVGLNVWRLYFARFRMVETELNKWSDYQASLLLNKFPHASSYTVGRNGKSMTIGWKGTPLHFISAWMFQ